MKSLIVIATFIGQMVVTSYRAVPEQTDNTPFYTSTNEHVRAGGCAISRDLLCGACRKLHHRCKRPDNPTKLHYGDWIYIDGYGFRQVNDVMAAYTVERHGKRKVRRPIRQQIDIFVWTWKQEHSVNVKHLNVFKIKEVVYE